MFAIKKKWRTWKKMHIKKGSFAPSHEQMVHYLLQYIVCPTNRPSSEDHSGLTLLQKRNQKPWHPYQFYLNVTLCSKQDPNVTPKPRTHVQYLHEYENLASANEGLDSLSPSLYRWVMDSSKSGPGISNSIRNEMGKKHPCWPVIIIRWNWWGKKRCINIITDLNILSPRVKYSELSDKLSLRCSSCCQSILACCSHSTRRRFQMRCRYL